jgi:hypothetical protein
MTLQGCSASPCATNLNSCSGYCYYYHLLLAHCVSPQHQLPSKVRSEHQTHLQGLFTRGELGEGLQ